MISASQNFKNQLASGNRDYLVNVDITLADSTVLQTVEKDGLIELSIEDAVSQDNKFTALGGAVINKATIILDNSDETYSNYNFINAVVSVKLGLLIDSTPEYVDRGVYIVDSASPKNSGMELSCLDYMSKFDKSYAESEMVYPATIQEVINNACTKCGVTFTGTYPDSNYVLTMMPVVSTFREVLSAIGQITGTYAHVDTQGRLYFDWFNDPNRNLLPYPYYNTTKTSYGITFTDNGDGSVTASGTRESGAPYSSFIFAYGLTGLIDGETYILKGCPSTGSRNTYYILVTETNPGFKQSFDTGEGASFVYHENSTFTVVGYVISEGEFNITFNPEIRLVSQTIVEDVMDINIAQDDITIAGVRCYIINAESGVVYEAHYPTTLTDDDFCVDITDNPFIQGSNVQEIVNRVGERICGLTIRQLNSRHLSNPLYEAGDVGQMLYKVKNNVYSYCPFVFTRTNFGINKAQETVCGIETLLENQSGRYSDAKSIKVYTQGALLTAKEAKQDADDAKKVATNYLSADTSGIMVADLENGVQTPSTATGRNVKIDNDSVDIRDGQKILASFGSTTTIGESGSTRLEIDYHSLKQINKENRAYLHISDLRNKQGVYTVTEVHTITERIASNKMIILGFDSNTLTSFLVNGVEHKQDAQLSPRGRAEELSYNFDIPVGTEVTIIYTTTEWTAAVYTLGLRAGANFGAMSIVTGMLCEASGYVSSASGWFTTASGYASHAEGADTSSDEYASHAEGQNTHAAGLVSHAEGESTVAGGAYSHAEGQGAHASGFCSHAEGSSTVADGYYSHAAGYNTIAVGYAQTVIGKYNIEDTDGDYMFIIGNGTADNARSNAFTVDWQGNVNIPSGASYQIDGVALDNRYIKKSGDTMTGGLTFDNVTNAIYYKGAYASYPMIKFKDGADVNGNGIVVGGGGLTVIGGGESANTIAATITSGGSEQLCLCNDGAIDIYTSCQSGAASAVHTTITGKTFSGRAVCLKDQTNDNDTYLNYGAAALTWSDITFFAAWNGYSLRAINKSQITPANIGAVAKAGDTMTGLLHINYSNASGDVGLYAKATNLSSSDQVLFGIGSSSNYGIYSWKLGKWLINGTTDNKVYLAGMNFTDAASARSSIGAATKSWTQIAQVQGTNSATYSLSGYSEGLLMIWTTEYFGTMNFVVSSLGSGTYEMYTGGWGNNGSTSNRAGCAKVSSTKMTGVMVRVNNSDVTASSYFRLYAR